jgi:hypothetical protein
MCVMIIQLALMNSIFVLVHFLALIAAARHWKSEQHAKQAEAAKRFQISHPLFTANLTSDAKNVTFSNPKASGTFSRTLLSMKRNVVKLNM